MTFEVAADDVVVSVLRGGVVVRRAACEPFNRYHDFPGGTAFYDATVTHLEAGWMHEVAALAPRAHATKIVFAHLNPSNAHFYRTQRRRYRTSVLSSSLRMPRRAAARCSRSSSSASR